MIAVLGSLIFLIGGSVKMVKVNTYPKTSAKITKIETVETAEPDEPDSYKAFVKYYVNGKGYEAELDNYKSSYREGEEILIRYDPEDPTDITAMSTLSASVVIAAGALFLVFGVLALRKNIIAAKNEESMNGEAGPDNI